MSPNFDVDVLKTFLAICEHGSFSRASDQVNKTQSAVSMQMKRLEEIIERPIFTKQGRTNKLTGDGERLLEYARRMAKLNDEAISAFRQPELTGVIRLGTPEDYADRLLPEILARFARTHPLVQIDVSCLHSGELANQISKNNLDLAIVTVSDTSKCDNIIRREQLVWTTCENHEIHKAETIPIALSHAGCIWRDMTISALETAGKPHRIAYASTNSAAIATMVLSGLAVAAIPKLALRQGMRILTHNDGYPALGGFDIGLMRAKNAQGCAINALQGHIETNFGNLEQVIMAAE